MGLLLEPVQKLLVRVPQAEQIAVQLISDCYYELLLQRCELLLLIEKVVHCQVHPIEVVFEVHQHHGQFVKIGFLFVFFGYQSYVEYGLSLEEFQKSILQPRFTLLNDASKDRLRILL